MSEPALRCVSCDQPLTGRYCSRCGEKRLVPEDHSLKRFVEHALAAVTNADGKVFLTLRLLFTAPGRLTADYLRGRRRPYIPPLELFLIANLIFFLLHPLIGSDVLTTDLNTNLHYTWHTAVAQSVVAPRLAVRGLTVEAYAAVFDPAAVTLAKSLVILVVPIFALAVIALYWGHRRHLSAHLVFALHFCSWWLLLICAVLATVNAVVRVLRAIAVFPTAVAVGNSIFVLNLALMTGYLVCAVRRVYREESAAIMVAKALTLGVAFDLSLQAYRFVLSFLTFWTT